MMRNCPWFWIKHGKAITRSSSSNNNHNLSTLLRPQEWFIIELPEVSTSPKLRKVMVRRHNLWPLRINGLSRSNFKQLRQTALQNYWMAIALVLGTSTKPPTTHIWIHRARWRITLSATLNLGTKTLSLLPVKQDQLAKYWTQTCPIKLGWPSTILAQVK